MTETQAAPKKPRQPRTIGAKKIFVVRANIAFTIAGPDRLAVQSMVTQALGKLKFPGCQDRQLKWSDTYTLEEYEALKASGIALKTRGKEKEVKPE